MNSIKALIGLSGIVVFMTAACVQADDAKAATACVDEIRRVCVQLEEDLDRCVSERGGQLSKSCRDELKSAMEMAADPNGPSACVPDAKKFCAGLEDDALGHCLV